VTANCLHPGFVATHFAQSDGGSAVRLLVKLIRNFGASPQEGAKTSIYPASSPEVEGVTGTYFVRSIPKRSAAISYYEALTGDDYVDEFQHGVEHSLVRSNLLSCFVMSSCRCVYEGCLVSRVPAETQMTTTKNMIAHQQSQHFFSLAFLFQRGPPFPSLGKVAREPE
jgi:hypothetical protein